VVNKKKGGRSPAKKKKESEKKRLGRGSEFTGVIKDGERECWNINEGVRSHENLEIAVKGYAPER